MPGVRQYVAVDGGMNDNIRPALYQAKYEAAAANRIGEAHDKTVSIAGKCCESGDMLIWDIDLPEVKEGDLLAVFVQALMDTAWPTIITVFRDPPLYLSKTVRLI